MTILPKKNDELYAYTSAARESLVELTVNTLEWKMICLNTNTLGLLSIFQALHSILGAISAKTFLIKKRNAFDQFLKRNAVKSAVGLRLRSQYIYHGLLLPYRQLIIGRCT